MLYVPLPEGKIGWVACHKGPEGERDPETGVKRMLVERYSNWAEPVPAMLEATPEGAITRVDVRDRVPVAHWGEGRVSLLGDAAHPMTFFLGQGACSALDDAFVLGRRLEQHGPGPEALRSHENLRVQQAGRTVKASYALSRVIRPESRPGSAVRNSMFRVLGHTVWKRLISAGHENLRAEHEAAGTPAARFPD